MLTTEDEVVEAFDRFLSTYKDYRKSHGLENKKIQNVHEVLTGMTDKHGRINRQIKHLERKDPKSDWPLGMTESMFGYLVYMIMLKDHYGTDLKQGIINELRAAVEQHGKSTK